MAVTAVSLESGLAQHSPRPWPRPLFLSVRRRFQRAAFDALPPPPLQLLDERIRRKLARWNHGLFPRVAVQRFRKLMAAVCTATPPRVAAAVWRTLWNGWVTSRRMRTLSQEERGCIYCCGQAAADSIEHYANCSILAQFAMVRLNLARPPAGTARLAQFLLLSPGLDEIPRETFIRRALLTAACYSVHNLVRYAKVQRGAAAVEALGQILRELVRGHRTAGRALDEVHG